MRELRHQKVNFSSVQKRALEISRQLSDLYWAKKKLYSSKKYALFKASSGWVNNFIKKNKFSMRTRTTGSIVLKKS